MKTAAVEERPDVDADTPSEKPVHLAKCAECAAAVKFRVSASGAGFLLVDAAPDASFGIGPNRLPLCPEGHGEMSIADETLKPVAEAVQEVLERQASDGPVQRTLPGCVPAFNFMGCYLELEKQAVLVESLRKEYEDDARVAKDSKKHWDDAEAKFTHMALEFRRRRQAKEDGSDEAAAPPTTRPACAWEAKHVGKTCPLCSGETVGIVVLAHLGDATQLAPTDASGHVDDVEKLLLGLEIEETRDALENVDTYITDEVIGSWSAGERAAVRAWADATLDKTNNVPDVVMPDRPKVLGKPHVPAKPVDGEHQVCTLCEVVIHAASDEENDPYRVTDYVGVDCAGKPAKVGHTYPKKKKPAAKAKKK